MLLKTIFNKYLYDQVGRHQKTWEQLTNTNLAADTLRLISQTNYNEIGQVYQKQLASRDCVNFLQAIAYTYNERGWLLSSTAPLFQMQLQYNTNALGYTMGLQYNAHSGARMSGKGQKRWLLVPGTNDFCPLLRMLSRYATNFLQIS